MLAPKGSIFNGRPTFANPIYLKKVQSEKPCLYEIPYDTSDPVNRFVPDREETLTLEKESRSKLNKDLVKPYDYTKYEPLEEDTDYVSEDESEAGEQRMSNDIVDDKPFTPEPQPEGEELSSDEDLDEWLKAEMEKHMCGQDKESAEDALIHILKSLGVSFVADNEEGDILGSLPCKLPPKELNPRSFTLPCTIGNLNLYVMADLGASVNVMPKLIFEHLKLANLKETDMVVEMADMTKKAPLGIVENIMVKINKFLFPSNFVIIDMLEEPSETMILGRPFLATILAQIDVFKREILLGIGEDRVKFDMDGVVCHSRILVEKIHMANSMHEEEYFNPLEIEDDVFSYESHACLLFEQQTQTYDNENVDTLDSANNMQELEDKHKDMVRGPNLESIISRWHVCKHVRVFYDNECGKDCGMWPTCNPDLSFCSEYDAIYGKDSFDVNADYGKTRDDPYSRRFDEYRKVFDNEIEQLANEYDLIIRKKGYALDDVWEKCEKFHEGTSYPWHDEGFKKEERWESGIEKTDYEQPFVDIETFEIKRC
ncbi:phospholipase-like protein [Tanacetum coccineum]